MLNLFTCLSKWFKHGSCIHVSVAVTSRDYPPRHFFCRITEYPVVPQDGLLPRYSVLCVALSGRYCSSSYKLSGYASPEEFSLIILGVSTMSKGQKSNKEGKKNPAMTPKEKRRQRGRRKVLQACSVRNRSFNRLADSLWFHCIVYYVFTALLGLPISRSANLGVSVWCSTARTGWLFELR